jgi:P-type Cu+ transporter
MLIFAPWRLLATSGCECKEEPMAKDPVCGMDVNDRDAKATAQHGGKSYNFCSTECRDQFQKNPERYTRQSA